MRSSSAASIGRSEGTARLRLGKAILRGCGSRQHVRFEQLGDQVLAPVRVEPGMPAKSRILRVALLVLDLGEGEPSRFRQFSASGSVFISSIVQER